MNGFRLRILGSRDVAEQRFDLGFDLVDIDIADHYYCLKVRTVPCVVEIPEAFRFESLEIFLTSDKSAGRIFRVAVIVWKRAFVHPPSGISSGPAFFYDYASFLVYFFRVACYIVGIVVHDEQAGVYYSFPYNGNIVEHVGSLLYSGGGIDVPAEFGSYRLEVIQHLFPGKILGSVETHVLEKMCKTVLIRSFLYCTDIGGKIKLGPLCRLVVVSDIVCQTVFKFSLAYLRIIGQQALSEHDCRRHDDGNK